MKRDMAGLLEHLDELIQENRRALAAIYVRGDKDSREYARQDGKIRGLGIACQTVAEWMNEDSEQEPSDQPESTV